MADKLTAVIGFAYPADAESLRQVREAGGLSKLRALGIKPRYKVVAPGEDCSDMPVESVALYVARGEVVRVVDETPVPRVTRRKVEA